MEAISVRAIRHPALYFLVFFSLGANGQLAPYNFKDVAPRKPLLEQRPDNLPERIQTQGPGRIDSSKWPVLNAEANGLDHTRIDLLERRLSYSRSD